MHSPRRIASTAIAAARRAGKVGSTCTSPSIPHAARVRRGAAGRDGDDGPWLPRARRRVVRGARHHGRARAHRQRDPLSGAALRRLAHFLSTTCQVITPRPRGQPSGQAAVRHVDVGLVKSYPLLINQGLVAVCVVVCIIYLVLTTCDTRGEDMKDSRLQALVRRILATSALLGGATSVAAAAPPPNLDLPSEPEEGDLTRQGVGSPADVVVRPARPKLLIHEITGHSAFVSTSHRSHRSHSSHRSHFSSSSPAPAPRPSTDTSRRPSPAAPAARADTGTPGQLGNRTLGLGMRGADVEQLIMILVRRALLPASKVPSEAIFNSDIESTVKAFQKANGLAETGRVDFRTLLLLRAQ